jgi:hypothetical protein
MAVRRSCQQVLEPDVVRCGDSAHLWTQETGANARHLQACAVSSSGIACHRARDLAPAHWCSSLRFAQLGLGRGDGSLEHSCCGPLCRTARRHGGAAAAHVRTRKDAIVSVLRLGQSFLKLPHLAFRLGNRLMSKFLKHLRALRRSAKHRANPCKNPALGASRQGPRSRDCGVPAGLS